MKRYTLLLLAALTGLGTLAQEVRQVNIGDNLNYGITYSLPVTAIRVNVKAHCKKTIAGQFAPYAEKFLGLQGVALENQTEYTIEQITLEGVAKPDTSRTYHIDFSEKGYLPAFYLTAEGGLWGINQKPEVKVSDEETEVPTQTKRILLKPSDVLTSEILKAGSKAKQADLCAQEIFSIRESRNELIRGEADNTPSDGKQLQLMLDNLTAQEEALLSLFVGNTTESDVCQSFDIVTTEEVDRVLAFRFSRELGFVATDDYAGAPYYISVDILEDNRLTDLDPKARKKADHGVAYCLPGKARVTLFSASETLAQGEMYMAQFGHVEQLPGAQFTDKKRPFAAIFTPSTGAVRLFEPTL